MDIKDIIIPDYMELPNPKKIAKARENYINHGTLTKPIIIDNKGILRDGYARYAALKECGFFGDINDIPVECTFVYGVHDDNPKEYVWILKKSLINKVSIGTRLLVPTKKGYKQITVTRVTTEVPKTNWPIKVARKVIENAY